MTIRGEELDQLAITGVSFDATSATSWVRVSDTEIRATHGALPTGSHVVHVQNDAGVDRTTAALAVLDAPVYATTVLPYPGTTSRRVLDLAYDAERQAILVGTLAMAGQDGNELLRWTYRTPRGGAPGRAARFRG